MLPKLTAVTDAPTDAGPPDVTVRRAVAGDLDRLAALFDDYRVVYGQEPAGAEARRFIGERIEKADSVIFVAEREGQVVGFSQLYPSFSSITMGRIWILNDLFVAGSVRRSGVASRLLEVSADFARRSGARRLELSTARDNLAARSLYEKMGWQLDEFFIHYYLATP